MQFSHQASSEILKKPISFDREDTYGNKDIECTLVAYKMNSQYVKNKDTVKQRASKPESVNDFNDKNGSGKIFITWLVWFHLSGPDARYLPANASLAPDVMWDIYNALKSAHNMMKKLSNAKLDGEYSKKFESENCFWRNPVFVVNSDYGDIYLVFWLSSDGKYQYSRRFDFEETAKLIDSLSKVFDEGPRLVEQFRSIL